MPTAGLVCVYVRMLVLICTLVCMFDYMHASLPVCMHVHILMYVSMSICRSVCFSVCDMYVCLSLFPSRLSAAASATAFVPSRGSQAVKSIFDSML